MVNQETDKKISTIIGGNVVELVKYAEQLGEKFAPKDERERQSKLSSSQIRNILDEVQRMKTDDPKQIKKQLQRLRPKLAYAAGKTKQGNSLRELQPILDKAIEKINTVEEFKSFKDFFEAIVGYHRFYSQIREA